MSEESQHLILTLATATQAVALGALYMQGVSPVIIQGDAMAKRMKIPGAKNNAMVAPKS